MPTRCVVYGCSNTTDTSRGIFLYQIPFWGDNTPVAIKRRVWITFVNTKRAKRTPSRSSVVCLNNFSKNCFKYGSETVGTYKVPKLKRDEYGVMCFAERIHVEKDSDREKRMKQREAKSFTSLVAHGVDAYLRFL